MEFDKMICLTFGILNKKLNVTTNGCNSIYFYVKYFVFYVVFLYI